jgi:hypothetical protein
MKFGPSYTPPSRAPTRWRLVQDGALPPAASFPYHGLPKEGDAGGTGAGAYAGLIDLLGTAVDGVRVVGPATVDGQRTTELSTVVDPAILLKNISLHRSSRV